MIFIRINQLPAMVWELPCWQDMKIPVHPSEFPLRVLLVDETFERAALLKLALQEAGAVNFPYLSDGMWFLTQHKRWGLLKEDPDYLAVAKKVNQVELYKQAATQTKTPIPKDLMRSSKLIDDTVWDGKNPKAYAAGFKVRA